MRPKLRNVKCLFIDLNSQPTSVRGKEIKQVEFGAKVNKIQIDGINFIEHIQYRAFNEGTRLQSSVFCAQNLTKTKIRKLGADAIYAPPTKTEHLPLATKSKPILSEKERRAKMKNYAKFWLKKSRKNAPHAWKEVLAKKKNITT